MATDRTSLQRAQVLVGRGCYQEAWRLLDDTAAQWSRDAGGWTLRAQIALQLRHYDSALQSIELAARLAPQAASVQYTYGRVYMARGDVAAALGRYRRALDGDPGNADILTSLGIALRAAGQLEQAVAAYRRALAASPNHVQAGHNLANALETLGAEGEVEQLRRATQPSIARRLEELHSQAVGLRARGQLAEALSTLNEALAIAPRAPMLLRTAATVAGECSPGDEALAFLDRLIEAVPADLAARRAAYLSAASAGLVERAERHAEQILRASPDDDARIARRLLLPAIHDSAASIVATRLRYECALDELLQDEELLLENPSTVFGTVGFYLAYQGGNDRELQIKAARAYLRALPSLRYVSPHCTRARRAGRIRLGVISKFLYAHSIGKTTRGLIEQLDRARFETYLIRIVPSRDDETTALMRAAADHTVEVDLQQGLGPAQQRLSDLELDILFYQDIGMEWATYSLSFARLAPVQCVSYGHPNTTGVSAIDYFVSNDLYETADAPAHYSERLFLLHDLPTLAYYHRPRAPGSPGAPAGRAALGLPDGATIYLCPQALFKLHPDFDPIIRGILERDSRGRLVLIGGHFRQWTEQLTARFARSMPAVADRVLFLPRLSQDAFMQLLANSDVMLDTLHFNGMNSSLEALAVGLPVVTLPTGLQRGRHTQAMYRRMGMDDCTASSADHYVDLAVRLGIDRAYRSQVRERILSRNAALYEDTRVVREFERFFEAALRERGVQIG